MRLELVSGYGRLPPISTSRPSGVARSPSEQGPPRSGATSLCLMGPLPATLGAACFETRTVRDPTEYISVRACAVNGSGCPLRWRSNLAPQRSPRPQSSASQSSATSPRNFPHSRYPFDVVVELTRLFVGHVCRLHRRGLSNGQDVRARGASGKRFSKGDLPCSSYQGNRGNGFSSEMTSPLRWCALVRTMFASALRPLVR